LFAFIESTINQAYRMSSGYYLVAWKCIASLPIDQPSPFQASLAKISITSIGMLERDGQEQPEEQPFDHEALSEAEYQQWLVWLGHSA